MAILKPQSNGPLYGNAVTVPVIDGDDNYDNFTDCRYQPTQDSFQMTLSVVRFQ